MFMDIETLKNLSEAEILDFIRKRLAFENDVIDSLRFRYGLDDDFYQSQISDYKQQHYRFQMHGAGATVYNQSVLNKFAALGIYEYVFFLSLDFYKGNVRVGLSYEYDGDFEVHELDCPTTSEIIYEILKLTVLSGRKKRNDC